MLSPDRKPNPESSRASFIQPPTWRESSTWIGMTMAGLGLVILTFMHLPDAKEQKALLSYTPIPKTVPTRTPSPFPLGVTLSLNHGTSTPTPDPRKSNTPSPIDRAFPGY